MLSLHHLILTVGSIGLGWSAFAQTDPSAMNNAQVAPIETKDNMDRPNLTVPNDAAVLTVTTEDALLWDGKRVSPKMQCGRNGGDKPASPKMRVAGVPSLARSLVVYVRNEPPSFDNHGLFRVLPQAKSNEVEWLVPSVRSHADATKWPQRVRSYAGGDTWGRIYSAPCPSNGTWRYSASVYALDEADKVLAYGKMDLGYAP